MFGRRLDRWALRVLKLGVVQAIAGSCAVILWTATQPHTQALHVTPAVGMQQTEQQQQIGAQAFQLGELAGLNIGPRLSALETSVKLMSEDAHDNKLWLYGIMGTLICQLIGVVLLVTGPRRAKP